jgi:hypothetical protein
MRREERPLPPRARLAATGPTALRAARVALSGAALLPYPPPVRRFQLLWTLPSDPLQAAVVVFGQCLRPAGRRKSR